MLKIIGICILIFTFCLVARELIMLRRRRLLALEELHRFLSFAKVRIECYLCKISEIARDFKSPTLQKSGFLSALSDGCGAAHAFRTAFSPTTLGERGYRVLDELFLSLGEGYLDGELVRIDAAVSELSELVAMERAEASRGARLVRTLCAALSLGVLIFAI